MLVAAHVAVQDCTGVNLSVLLSFQVTGKAECPAENTSHGISWKVLTLAAIFVPMARHEIPS